ncbi:MAG: lmo0937 family membrane protein [Bacteroidota bacterium]|nr:lmo0937 family membrane protein [Bacteroidota bacterium]MDP4196362.1 lmo0937 family membrane protein [Bacteroidota bacterium]
MLWNFFILLFIWLLGIVNSYTLGGLIHVVLVLAIITVTREFIRDRRQKIF